MSERKVLNKYYPPDFDPSKVPRGKRNKNATFNIRIMAPFNMRCNMCKEYIYKGKKFNSRKEDVMDEDYLGLRIFRFYIKCPRCVSEIAFKTDLKNTDYALEAGATRLFEAEKIAQQMAEQERKEKEEDELNPMKVLENRTKQSQLEMEQIDSLEELREMNTRKNAVNTDEMIEKYRKYEELLLQLQMEEEEKQIREIFGGDGSGVVKRLHDSDSDDEDKQRQKVVKSSTSSNATDILTSNSEQKAVKTKAPKVWEKSVGSMSSKSKLSGLVVKKKPVQLPPFSVSQSTQLKTKDSDLINTCTVTDSKSTEMLSNGTVSLNVVKESDVENKKQIINVEPTVTDKLNIGTESQNTSRLGGLGMLGAYSDSESDASE